MKPTRPEKLSEFVRKVWEVKSVLCALFALVCVIRDDMWGAIMVSLAGIAFYVMSRTLHDDLDL